MQFILTILLIPVSLTLFAQDLTTSTDAFLKKNVKDGLVNYKGIKAAPQEMNALLKQVASAPEYAGNQEKAFLINAYNLFVIKGIVEHFPVQGPLEINGFFNKKKFTLRGEETTLDQLEKETLSKQFPDPRLHFALVCAALGCPKLVPFAYTANQLEEQLEQQTRRSINDRDFIRVNGPVLEISQLFDWYAADFGGKQNIVPFIQKYHLLKVKFSPKYTFYEYDWTLNTQR